MSKETILNKVQEALKQNPLQQNERGAYTDILKPIENDILSEYKRGQEVNKAILIESTKDELESTIKSILEKENIKQVLLPVSLKNINISQEKIIYNKPVDELRDTLFQVECGIFEANYGVSNLGIFSVASSSDQPRLLSLITKYNIVLLKKENIKENLATTLKAYKEANKDKLPTNILFIAGPSRTADIEFKVVLGVHGPQIVYVILY